MGRQTTGSMLSEWLQRNEVYVEREMWNMRQYFKIYFSIEVKISDIINLAQNPFFTVRIFGRVKDWVLATSYYLLVLYKHKDRMRQA